MVATKPWSPIPRLSVFSPLPFPTHINTSIPCSQALRIGRIYLSEKGFKTHISGMKEWFLARVYPEIVVNNQRDKVIFGKDWSVKKTSENGIPFVTTYHPKVKELAKLIRDLCPSLNSDEEVQIVFSPSLIVSYRSPRKIMDYIVRSRLHLDERKVGCRG